MAEPQELRRHERYGGTLTVQVTADGTQRFGTVYEVSLGGAFLEVSPLPAADATVDLIIVEGGRRHTLRASVKYRMASEAGARGIEGVGVAWGELDADGRALVERLVARAAAGKPLRGD
jgi:hypothetical protein